MGMIVPKPLPPRPRLIGEDGYVYDDGKPMTFKGVFHSVDEMTKEKPKEGDCWIISGDFSYKGIYCVSGNAVVWKGSEWFMLKKGISEFKEYTGFPGLISPAKIMDEKSQPYKPIPLYIYLVAAALSMAIGLAVMSVAKNYTTNHPTQAEKELP